MKTEMDGLYALTDDYRQNREDKISMIQFNKQRSLDSESNPQNNRKADGNTIKYENMKKITLMFLLSLCILTLNAQQNINVSILTKVINDEVYILTTITNNNDDSVVVSANGISEGMGIVSEGSNSFIILIAYDTNNLLIGTSNTIFIPKNLDDSKIKLMKGESYQKLDRLYCSNGFYGYYNEHFGTELSKIQAKVHLRYLQFKSTGAEIHEEDILSNEIMSLH